MEVINIAISFVPCPCLDVAFSIFQSIVEAVEMVQSNKEELIVMRECIRVLLRAINLQYIEKKLQVSSTRTAIDDLTALLHEIAGFVKSQSSVNFFKHLFYKDSLRARIHAYYTRLQFTIQAFQIVALVNIEAYQNEGSSARRRDQQNLNTRLLQLQADNDQLMETLRRGTGRAGGEDREAILTTMQQRLNRGQGDDVELQFYRKMIQQLPADERKRRPVEVPRWMISPFDVEREAAIGMGGYGTVYRGTWRNQAVAIKVMKTKENIYPNPEALRKEISIWESLEHPNIIKFLGANTLDDEPFIVMPLARYGNAKAYLDVTPDCNRTKLMRDVACGLAYLHHDKRIVHGDIKAVNILIDRIDGEPTKAMLCDFGLATIKHDIQTRSSVNPSSLVGTRNYMAPEAFEGAPSRFAADIYSLGMTMYEIFTGEVPFGDIGPELFYKLVVERNTRPQRPSPVEAPQISDNIWTLITQCWSREPADRPSAPQVHRTLKLIADMTRRRDKVSTSSQPPSHLADSLLDLGRSKPAKPQGGCSETPGLRHDMSRLVAARPTNPSSLSPTSGTPTHQPVLNVPDHEPQPRTRVKTPPSPSPKPSERSQGLVKPPISLSSSSSLPLPEPSSSSLQPPSAPSMKHRSSSSRSPSPIPHFLEALAQTTATSFPMKRPWRSCLALGNPAHVTSLSLSPDGDLLVVGLANGHFEMWNPRQATKIPPKSKGQRTISASPIVASSTINASGSFALGLANGAIAQYHADLGVSIKRFDNKECVRCICLASGSSGKGGADEVLILNARGEIVIWPISLDQAETEMAPKRVQVPELREELVPVTCGSFSPDGSLLFVGMANGYLYTIDTSTGRPTREPFAYGNTPPSPVQPPSLFDVLTSPNGVAEPRQPVDWVSCESLVSSPDGRKVLVGYSTGEIRLWDVVGGSKVVMRSALSPFAPRVPNHSTALAFSPDGSKVVYPSLQVGKMVEIQDVSSRQIVATVQLQYAIDSDASREQEGMAACLDHRIQTIALARDNRMLVVSFEESADVMVWLW